MVEPVFRAARRDDVPAIVDLLRDDALGQTREAAVDRMHFAAFDAMQAEPGNLLVVGEIEGRIVACYQLTLISGLSLRATRRAQVEGVRVAADLRGRGLGARLMADAEARARDNGATLMQLTSNSGRADAHRFYGALGYAPSHVGFKKSL